MSWYTEKYWSSDCLRNWYAKNHWWSDGLRNWWTDMWKTTDGLMVWWSNELVHWEILIIWVSEELLCWELLRNTDVLIIWQTVILRFSDTLKMSGILSEYNWWSEMLACWTTAGLILPDKFLWPAWLLICWTETTDNLNVWNTAGLKISEMYWQSV